MNGTTHLILCEECGEYMKSIFDPSFDIESDYHEHGVPLDAEPDWDLLSKDAEFVF